MVTLATLMEAPPSWFIHATLVTNQFIWSGMHVASHPALEFFPPHVFAAFRMSFGLPFIAAFARTVSATGGGVRLQPGCQAWRTP